MINKIISYAKKNNMFDKCGHIVLGLSGGADSVCLLDVLVKMSVEFGFAITAVHVHHGIRGEEADRDMNFCAKLCEQYGVEFIARQYNVPEIAKESGDSVEEAGRKVRYSLFDEVAARYDSCKIALAHHANDNAETVIFNMARGTGVRGLHGIKVCRGNIVRPLLCVTRSEIEAFIKENKIDYCDDSTNFLNDYTRNKIRNVVLPELTSINSGAVRNINRLSEKITELEEFIDAVVDDEYKKNAKKENDGIVLFNLEKEPTYIAKELIIRAISELVSSLKDITDTHISQIYELINGPSGNYVDIKYGVTARRETDGIFLSVSTEKNDICYAVNAPMDIVLGDGNYICFRKEAWDQSKKILNQVYTKFFDYDKIKFDLQLRTKEEGDYITIDKLGHRKKLNQYFIDEKFPLRKREDAILLADGSHIMWVIGGRISEEYKISDTTKEVLIVEYRCNYGEDRRTN